MTHCKKCLLTDHEDPNLFLNSEGICNYCVEYDTLNSTLDACKNNQNNLSELINKIKKASSGKKYDCIVGVSGGVDSSYTLLKTVDLGLNPLVVHYDNGWNSEFAVNNIRKLICRLDLDLYTYVSDWDEFREIQRSFLKASVMDIELISDLGILGSLYEIAKKHKIKYIITGHNDRTESHLPSHWYHWKIDWLNLRSIHKAFSKRKIKTLPHLNFLQLLLLKKLNKVEFVPLLNYLDYNKTLAQEELNERIDWTNYKGKHYESIFTRFYQGYILPVKFGIDKKKSHYSSLICAGIITREQALLMVENHHYTPSKMAADKEYVIKKLGFTEAEFEEIMNLPVRSHFEFASYITRHYKIISFFTSLYKRKKG